VDVRDQDVVPTDVNWESGEAIADPLEILLTASWLDGAGRVQTQTLLTAKSR